MTHKAQLKAASRTPQAASRTPQVASRKSQAASSKQAASKSSRAPDCKLGGVGTDIRVVGKGCGAKAKRTKCNSKSEVANAQRTKRRAQSAKRAPDSKQSRRCGGNPNVCCWGDGARLQRGRRVPSSAATSNPQLPLPPVHNGAGRRRRAAHGRYCVALCRRACGTVDFGGRLQTQP